MRSKKKLLFLTGLILVYLLVGAIMFVLVDAGIVSKLIPPARDFSAVSYNLNESDYYLVEGLNSAESFFEEKLRREGGHIDLYYTITGEATEPDFYTNSEAVSYYLFWKVREKNKVAFDEELDFIEENMVHPEGDFIMWKLDSNDEVIDDGANVATDADLRMLHALFIARDNWGDERYEEIIERISGGLGEVGITSQDYFAPYGGFREGEVWKTEEVWLSYSDFNAFAQLGKEDSKWERVYHGMKDATLNAQDGNGLYFTQIEENGEYSSRLDNGKYSINTLWIMVSNAESNDPELQASARTALNFYKEKYSQDGIIFTEYNKDGSPASGGDSPWVYALVGRAAIMLEDEEFADSMIFELLQKQNKEKDSELYGAFPEGPEDNKKVGQFTMQESIIALQHYLAMKAEKNKEEVLGD